MRKRAQVFYAGRVQGVGFRYVAREVAYGFDVTGYVQNLADGRVELVAEGEQAEAEAFLAAIVETQLGSHIRTADVGWLPATGEFNRFEIRN